MDFENKEILISYSDQYRDDYYVYLIVYLDQKISQKIPINKRGFLLREPEWRELGIKLFKGWLNYDVHYPDPYILFFRKRIDQRIQEKKKQQTI
ncbi:unnamed protein product [Paramecium primaurelia]|uniref:Cyclin-dependent kinases regulatory subunit n=1 Tax=Paramecium primaurelia TaxID=5886 RepID=A0A8S1LSB9_PARPR|nr:unnamed protein product [Paramecium primaurelia]